MLIRRFLPALLTACAAVPAIIAFGPTSVAHAADLTVVQSATLNGDGGGSFASHTATLTACNEYTLRLNYTMSSGGTPTENGIGVEVWNDEGDAFLTSSPFGARIWNGPSQKYYLQSFRTATNPFVEEVRFKVGQSLSVTPWCSDMTPNYTFRVFNYLTGTTLNYTLIVPGGIDN